MKKTLLTFALSSLTYFCHAQNNFPSPGPGDVTINTTVPADHGGGYNALWMPNAGALMPENALSYAGIMLTSNVARSPTAGNWSFVNSAFPAWKLYLGYGANTDYFYIARSAPSTYSEQIYFKIANSGYVGIGTTSPQTNLHIVGSGASIDAQASYTGGGLIIQGNTGSRSSTTGAQLEFVTPANADGTNLWGQGRIITVAGNSNSGDATGEMILGTRRYINKVGAGLGWYYGNDLVINGNGNIIIGQTTQVNSAYKLDVYGSARATAITVNATGADFVFESTYKLFSLPEIEKYIQANHHLPEIPSAKEMQTNGLNVGDNQIKLLQKVEELTLFMIEKDKQINEQQKQIVDQQIQLNEQQDINQKQLVVNQAQQAQIDLLIKQVAELSKK